MRSICTLIIIGCISFVGHTAYAQPAGSGALESIRQSLTAEGNGEGGGSEGGTSLSDRMNAMLNSSAEPTPSPVPVELAPIIDIPIIPETIDVPEVNQGTAEVIDTRGRYRPKLKVNFTEFPLRSLTSANHTENGIAVREVLPLDTIVRRLKDRFHLSQLHLSVNDRKAMISGTADTEYQREMIAMMLRFEPGIDSVQNEITIVPEIDKTP